MPIALGILYASGQVNIVENIDEYEFAGELSLSGELRKISSAIPMAIKCVEENKNLLYQHKIIKRLVWLSQLKLMALIV